MLYQLGIEEPQIGVVLNLSGAKEDIEVSDESQQVISLLILFLTFHCLSYGQLAIVGSDLALFFDEFDIRVLQVLQVNVLLRKASKNDFLLSLELILLLEELIVDVVEESHFQEV